MLYCIQYAVCKRNVSSTRAFHSISCAAPHGLCCRPGTGRTPSSAACTDKCISHSQAHDICIALTRTAVQTPRTSVTRRENSESVLPVMRRSETTVALPSVISASALVEPLSVRSRVGGEPLTAGTNICVQSTDAVMRFEACAAAAGGIHTAVGAATPLATGSGRQDNSSPESVENVWL